MKRIFPIIMLLTLSIMVMAACSGGGGSVETAVTEPTSAVPADDYGPTPDASAAVAILPTPVQGTPSAVADINLYVRSGPGLNYPVYGALLGGESASVVGKSQDGQWWTVGVPVAPTGQGWVPAALVSASNTESVQVVQAPPLPPTVEIQPPGPEDPQGTALVEAHVRRGPGTNYPSYGIVKPGMSAGIIGQSEDGQYWVVRVDPANIGLGHAWVAKVYVQAKNVENIPTIKTPPIGDTVNIEPPPAGVPSAIATDYLNVRTGPGTNYPILGVVPPGTSGQLVGISPDSSWYAAQVSPEYYAAGQAWVAAAWVVTQNVQDLPVIQPPPAPPSVEVPQPPDTSQATGIATEPINVRSGPGTQYPSYGAVPIGSTGQIVGVSEDGNWWVVSISQELDPSGQGWVNAAYVLAQGAENVPVIPTPPLPPTTELPPPAGDVAIGTALETINVRSGPGTQFPSYGIAPKGTTGEVTGVLADGSWYQVKAPALSPDGIAWVAAAYVFVTNADNIPEVTP